LEEEMAHSINVVNADAATGTALREQTAVFLRVRMWGIDVDEPHRDALAPGDLILVYLGAPAREFIGRDKTCPSSQWTIVAIIRS
jgi:hypothetical protein